MVSAGSGIVSYSSGYFELNGWGNSTNDSHITAGGTTGLDITTGNFSFGIILNRTQFAPTTEPTSYGYGGIFRKRYYQDKSTDRGWALFCEAGNIYMAISDGTNADSFVVGSMTTIVPSTE